MYPVSGLCCSSKEFIVYNFFLSENFKMAIFSLQSSTLTMIHKLISFKNRKSGTLK